MTACFILVIQYLCAHILCTGCLTIVGLRKYPKPDLDNANVGMQARFPFVI